MIELVKVSKSYGEKVAVSEVSFKVEEGETLVLLGTSGCGKTTTLKMINRLIEPDTGQIIIDGAEIRQQQPEKLRRGIGYVMQNIGLFPHYSIEENMAVVPKLLRWTKQKTTERIHEIIKKLHLPSNVLKRFPDELSGGQQQRVGLARALIADPSILLMDEPFGALDNVTRTSIQQEFKNLETLKKKTIVMVTHDVLEAFVLADRICLMDKGKVMQIGTPKDLLFNPANDFSKKFLDGQRLALGFQVVQIKDVWFDLPDGEGNDGKSLAAELNIWEAMEKLRSSDSSTLSFHNVAGAEKVASFEDLTKAFNQYKTSNIHE